MFTFTYIGHSEMLVPRKHLRVWYESEVKNVFVCFPTAKAEIFALCFISVLLLISRVSCSFSWCIYNMCVCVSFKPTS